MGARGPAPKRSTERHGHRGQADEPEQVEQDGAVSVPPAGESWHSVAREWYESLPASGQSKFYEPSDWQQAHFCAELMHRALTDEKVNAQLVAQIRGLMTDLLTSEASRRRVSMEIVRPPKATEGTSSQPASNVTSMDERRKRVGNAS